MVKIDTKAVKCMEIFVGDESIGVFRVAEEWNGLVELRRIKDGQLLVIGEPHGGGFARVFGEIFGTDEKSETYLVNGSPDIIRRIQQIASSHDTAGEGT